MTYRLRKRGVDLNLEITSDLEIMDLNIIAESIGSFNIQPLACVKVEYLLNFEMLLAKHTALRE